MRGRQLIFGAVALALSGCNQNSAIGNDREAALDPPPSASPIADADDALKNVSTGLVKPETLSNADIEAIGGIAGKCVFKLTEVSFPVLVYEPRDGGHIKLNGTLIPLSRLDEQRFSSGALRAAVRPLDGSGNAGYGASELVVVTPGAKDELGYHGYAACF